MSVRFPRSWVMEKMVQDLRVEMEEIMGVTSASSPHFALTKSEEIECESRENSNSSHKRDVPRPIHDLASLHSLALFFVGSIEVPIRQHDAMLGASQRRTLAGFVFEQSPASGIGQMIRVGGLSVSTVAAPPPLHMTTYAPRFTESLGCSFGFHSVSCSKEQAGLGEGPILEAQKKAAELFGATETWFLVGGTCGVEVSMMSTCSPGGYAHSSQEFPCISNIWHGFVWCFAQVLIPEYNSPWAIAGRIKLHQVAKAVDEVNKAKKQLQF
ncbi:hypothetical protein EJ110_NYTH24904 [Nymphaea thermarum]|nr:hypothetical protein EJ110_NYTH24904 [Nymphaea thermarum]